MKTFPFRPQAKPTISSNPESVSAKFGNGYEQVAPAGLNNDLKKYNQRYIIREHDKQRFNDFLNEHGTHKAFLIYSYSRLKYVAVRAENWSEQPSTGAKYTEFTLSVKEVVV